MFWKKNNPAATPAGDPKWETGWWDNGQNVYTFVPSRRLIAPNGQVLGQQKFGSILAAFRAENPRLKVVTMTPYISSGYTIYYVAVMEPVG